MVNNILYESKVTGKYLANLSVSISAGEVAHLWTEVHSAGIARHHVALEHLLPHLLEPVAHLVDDDLVVQALTGHHLPIGRGCDSRHTVHAGV